MKSAGQSRPIFAPPPSPARRSVLHGDHDQVLATVEVINPEVKMFLVNAKKFLEDLDSQRLSPSLKKSKDDLYKFFIGEQSTSKDDSHVNDIGQNAGLEIYDDFPLPDENGKSSPIIGLNSGLEIYDDLPHSYENEKHTPVEETYEEEKHEDGQSKPRVAPPPSPARRSVLHGENGKQVSVAEEETYDLVDQEEMNEDQEIKVAEFAGTSSTILSSMADHKAWLWRKESLFKTSRYWALIYNSSMYLYNGAQDKAALQTIPLQGGAMKKHKNGVKFVLTVPGGGKGGKVKQHQLNAEDEEKTGRWIKALEHAIAAGGRPKTKKTDSKENQEEAGFRNRAQSRVSQQSEVEIELEEADEYDDIEPLEDIKDDSGDEVYDDMDLVNQEPTLNTKERHQLEPPQLSVPGLSKSKKSGPPPPAPSKKNPEPLSFETYETNVILHNDALEEEPERRKNKLSRKDSSFEYDFSDTDIDLESPETPKVVIQELTPKLPIVTNPPELPAPKPIRKPPPTKPISRSSVLHNNKSEVNLQEKFNNPIGSKSSTAGPHTPVGWLPKPKPSTLVTPFKPLPAPKPMKNPLPAKPVSNLYRADNLSGRSPPRASMPAFQGNMMGDLGAALERRRLQSVGVSEKEAVDRVEMFRKQPREDKVVSEADKPKFVGILRR